MLRLEYNITHKIFFFKGGWMMIANVSFVNDDDRHNYVLDRVLSFDPYSLEDVKTGIFLQEWKISLY